MEMFKEALTRLLVPLAKPFAALRIAPNAVSLSGVVFGVLSAWCFVSYRFGWAVALFVLSGLSDTVDGLVARLRGITSSFGAYFDNFCGAYTDSAVFCGVIAAGLCSPLWGAFAVIGTLMRLLTFRLPSVIEARDWEAPDARFPYGLGGKADRIAIVGLGAVLGRISEAMIVVAILTNGIVLLRTLYCYRSVRAGGNHLNVGRAAAE